LIPPEHGNHTDKTLVDGKKRTEKKKEKNYCPPIVCPEVLHIEGFKWAKVPRILKTGVINLR
jgi:hypothetical protein